MSDDRNQGDDRPDPYATAARVAVLQDALFGRVRPEDVTDVCDSLIGQAKGGSLRAVELLIGLIRADAVGARVRPAGPAVPASAHLLRRFAAHLVYVHGPQSPAALAAHLGLDRDGVANVMGHEWFVQDGGAYKLTSAGRQTVG